MVQCRSWDEAETHIKAMQEQIRQLADRLRFTEKQLDTKGSPWWKRVWFRIDGWPPWYVVATQRQWRPWHKGTEGQKPASESAGSASPSPVASGSTQPESERMQKAISVLVAAMLIVGCSDSVTAPERLLSSDVMLTKPVSSGSSLPTFKNASEAEGAILILFDTLMVEGGVFGEVAISYPDSVRIFPQINKAPQRNGVVLGWISDETQIEWTIPVGLEMLPTWGWFRPTTTTPASYTLVGTIFTLKNGVKTYYASDSHVIIQP